MPIPSTETFRNPRPAFLDLLDTDRDRAFRLFYEFTHRFFRACPPRAVRMVPEDRREDLVHDVILLCCENDFRVLRNYTAQGRAFSLWFSILARRKIIDWLRGRADAEKTANNVEFDAHFERNFDANHQAPDRLVARRALLDIVRGAVERLGPRCRLLVLGAAEELKPRELVRFLGASPDENKKISDALRECRRQLRYQLRKAGVSLDSVSIFMNRKPGARP
jgi:RNA polymerase sigma factor (sigma-70 family)